jgi:glycosyltransferase involved in cell wall biosynthesis
MTLLSIIMPALAQRAERSTMAQQIYEQTVDLGDEVEFYALVDNGARSTGAKRNALLALCRGDYVCAVDDDDLIADDYIASLLRAIRENHGIDCITFNHTYEVNGNIQAITYQVSGRPQVELPKKPTDDLAVHYRLPGLLCPVRREIATAFQYPDTSHKEDYAYKDYLAEHARTYFNIPHVLYQHRWLRENVAERYRLKRRWGRM